MERWEFHGIFPHLYATVGGPIIGIVSAVTAVTNTELFDKFGTAGSTANPYSSDILRLTEIDDELLIEIVIRCRPSIFTLRSNKN